MTPAEALRQEVLDDISAFKGRAGVFCDIVAKFLRTGESVDERVETLARMTGETIVTVIRWARGESIPHPLDRPTILEAIRRILTAS